MPGERVAVIAHRGASGRFPENTLEAFAEAARAGADMVELDVRRTADGALAVHHDPFLPDGRAIVATRCHDLPSHVPLLAAALDACEGMSVNVEIKNFPGDPDYDPDQAVAAAVAALVVERGDSSRVLVSSFNLAAVDVVRSLEPGIPTGFVTSAGWDQHDALVRAADRGHRAIHPEDGAVTTEVVVAAHAAGLAVNAWTVDDADRMRALAAMGVDGIITNFPDVAVAVVRDALAPRSEIG